MGFARYRQIKAEQQKNNFKPEIAKSVKEKSITEKPPRADRNQRSARRQLTICEREIASQEELLTDLETQLENAGADYEKYSALYEEKTAAERKLDELMQRWETLAEEAGE